MIRKHKKHINLKQKNFLNFFKNTSEIQCETFKFEKTRKDGNEEISFLFSIYSTGMFFERKRGCFCSI
jgi:hypothetical protein